MTFFGLTPSDFCGRRSSKNYIVDFYCAKAKLVIELDGSQHYQTWGMEHDTERTAFLSEYGLTVLRIPNTEVNRNFRGVCEWIDLQVKERINASLV